MRYKHAGEKTYVIIYYKHYYTSQVIRTKKAQCPEVA